MAAQPLVCKGCWENLKLPVPLRGIASAPFRAVGIRPRPHEPEYLHDLRDDVRAGHESASDRDRRDNPVR